MADAITINNLTKVYGRRKRVVAVDNLNLNIAPGQVFGFLGPNGAGKSTTIRMALDLINVTKGEVFIYGKAVKDDHTVLRRVGAIVEGADFYPYLSGRRNLQLLARTANHYDADRIEALLVQVGLGERADQRVGGYSLGMKQRLGLAAALLSDPDLLILDEPTNGLDPTGIREIRRFIRQLVDEQGKTVFLSSHMLSEVEQVCDRVGIILKGKLIQEGLVSDLLGDSARLHLTVTPVEQAAALLRERYEVSMTDDGLTLDATREQTPHIVAQLVRHDIQIYAVNIQRQTLEDYFIQLTGDQDAPQMAMPELEAFDA